MSDKYEIRAWCDNEYAVYEKGSHGQHLFIGTIEQVNAFISLKEKGFNLRMTS